MSRTTTTSLFHRTSVKIASVTPDWMLDAWKYVPVTSTKNSKLPVVVLGHGMSATKRMGLDAYADAFASAGYACVAFDYRRWGDSDGFPRHCLVISEQQQDYRTVVKWVRQQPEFDPQRVILWGSSLAGGHVLTLSADPALDVFACIGQCPYVGEQPFKLSWSLCKVVALGILDLLKQAVGLDPVYIPVAGRDGDAAALTTPGSREGMLALVRNGQYPNEIRSSPSISSMIQRGTTIIAASAMFAVPFYRPRASAAGVQCPMLMVIPEKDNLCFPSSVEAVVGASKRGEAAYTPGGHFSVYPGSGTQDFAKSLEAQMEFLAKHVPL